MERFESELCEVRQLSDELRELRLRRADGAPLRYVPGQYIVLHAQPERDCYYSICSPPTAPGDYSICLRQGAGDCPRYLLSLSVGDRIATSGPGGALTLESVGGEDLLLVATGTGIAPFHAMIDQLRARPVGSQTWLLHGARRPEELLYHDEWQALATQHAGFSYHPTVSRPTSADRWREPVGRVTRLTATLCPQLDLTRSVAYLCGVPQMVKDVRAQLLAAGLSAAAIRTESG